MNYSESLLVLYPGLQLNTGEVYMRFLSDAGVEEPKSFMHNEQTLQNEKVREMNLKTVVKLLSKVFETDFISQMGSVLSSHNKISFLCLQAAEYLKTQDPQLREVTMTQLCGIDEGGVAPVSQ